MCSSHSLDAARQRIHAAYDPTLLRGAGHRLADLLADHLAAAESCQGDVLPWREPSANVRDADAALDEATGPFPTGDGLAEHFGQLVQRMLQRGLNLHDPRYIGHQVAAPVPLAGLFDAVGSVTNQVMAIYEMGPWATAVEWALVQRLGQLIGWPRYQFSGLVTHGGSLANLTALLTARNVALGDSWERGLAGRARPPVLVVHADAHYGVSRAAGMMGIGTDQVIRVPLDEKRRMDPERLDEIVGKLRAENQPIVAVVACACATPIGAFDPLNEIADVCQRYDVWLHVDAAHGGAAFFSSRHRPLLAGSERCDSLIWDAHKMLFVPGLCAFVFYRDRAHRFETFRQNAPYLFDPSAPGLAEYDSGLRTVECTKRAAAFGLWGIWSMFGAQLFEDLVDVTFDLAQVLYDKICAAHDFQAAHQPQCNIVVFRYVPDELHGADTERLGRFQLELRRALIESGDYYIVSTNLDGIGALRVTLINPLTTHDCLDSLLEKLREKGRELLECSRSRHGGRQ